MADPLSTNILAQAQWISESLTVAAANTLQPGHLVQFASDTSVALHGSAAGTAEPLFVPESDGASLLDNESFAAGESVVVARPKQGAIIHARLSATNAAISRGDPLASAGDGTLDLAQAVSVNEGGTATVSIPDHTIVGFADESVAASAGATNPFIRIRVA